MSRTRSNTLLLTSLTHFPPSHLINTAAPSQILRKGHCVLHVEAAAHPCTVGDSVSHPTRSDYWRRRQDWGRQRMFKRRRAVRWRWEDKERDAYRLHLVSCCVGRIHVVRPKNKTAIKPFLTLSLPPLLPPPPSLMARHLTPPHTHTIFSSSLSQVLPAVVQVVAHARRRSDQVRHRSERERASERERD